MAGDLKLSISVTGRALWTIMIEAVSVFRDYGMLTLQGSDNNSQYIKNIEFTKTIIWPYGIELEVNHNITLINEVMGFKIAHKPTRGKRKHFDPNKKHS